MNLTEPHCGTDLGLLRTGRPRCRRATGSYAIFFRPEDISISRRRTRHVGKPIIHPWCWPASRGATDGHQGHFALHRAEATRSVPMAASAKANGVSCGSIEEKMGIHGNATCVMNYDEAEGYLIACGEWRPCAPCSLMMNGGPARRGHAGAVDRRDCLPERRCLRQGPPPGALADRTEGRRQAGRSDHRSLIRDIRRKLMTYARRQRGGQGAHPLDGAQIRSQAPLAGRSRKAAGRRPSWPDDARFIKGVLTDKGFGHLGHGPAGLMAATATSRNGA